MEDKEEMEGKEAKEKRKGANPVSRRSFIKGAGLVVGGVAAGACAPKGGEAPAEEGIQAPKEVIKEVIKEVPVSGVLAPADEPEVSVIRGSSLSGFGRDGMPMSVEVKNGKIVRIRPLQFEQYGYTEDHVKPWKWTVRDKTIEWPMKILPSWHGLAYKKRVYSPNRIKYPLKRVDWEPGGDPAKTNPQNRGKSKYKRISWDEATDIIASEIDRIQKKYGYFAILAQGDGHGEGKMIHGPHGCQTQLLRHMGPDLQSSYTMQVRTPDSWEGWYWGAKHMWGCESRGNPGPQGNLTKDIVENCEMIVFNCDAETTTCGFGGQAQTLTLYWLDDLGIECVYVTPDLNYAGAVHADKWIPVLPCQDTALQLAIAYTWIEEDTYDKEYIETHSVGFDKFKAHVMGEDDGVPKTPEWASPLCGVPVWTIKALARNWAQKKTSTGHYLGGPMARGPYSTEVARTQIAINGMQGLGAPGRADYRPGSGLPGSDPSVMSSFDAVLVQGEPAPARGLEEWTSAQDWFRPHQFIPKTLIIDAILNPPIEWYGTASAGMITSDQFRPFKYPIDEADGGTRIHMVWTDTPCMTTCWNGGNRYVDAMRDPSIEFILTEHPWLEDDTMLSDIILPTTTKYEEYDLEGGGGTFRSVWMVDECVKPVGEAKTDFEVSLEVAKKLEKLGHTGLVEKYTHGRSVEDWMKYGWDTRMLEEGTGMTWEEFKEKGFYVIPTDPDWEKKLNETPPGMRGFYEDPQKNPLQTPSGLLEYESTALLENFPDDKERPPVPHWIVGGPDWTHDETLDVEGGAEKCKKYPFLLISNHPRWRVHAEHDDISWLREIPTCKVKGPDGYMYEPVWINPKDAAEKGIVSGDVVSLVNDRGTVLGGAYVTERIIPGAVYQDHGARADPIVWGPDEYIDRGGANNLICPVRTVSTNASGQVASGFLVDVQKTDLAALRAEYPEAFDRDYDPASGLQFSGWIEEA